MNTSGQSLGTIPLKMQSDLAKVLKEDVQKHVVGDFEHVPLERVQNYLNEPKQVPLFNFKHVKGLIEKPKPIDWLIKGYVENDAISTTYGEPGVGKTFFAIDMACCIATGIEWHGSITKPKGSVFYILGEGHAGISRRLAAWNISHSGNLENAPFYVSETSAAFTDEASALSVSNAIDKIVEATDQQPCFVVIDTLNRNFGAGDENSTRDMTAFIQHIDVLIRQKFKCHVMIVHHSGKDVTRGARGSGALKAAVDAEYEISKAQDKVLKLKVTKMKDAEAPAKTAYKTKIVALPWDDEDGNPMASLVLEKTLLITSSDLKISGSNQKKAFDLLKELFKEYAGNLEKGGYDPANVRVSYEAWVKKCADEITTSKGNPIHRKSISTIINSLKDGGVISVDNGYVTMNFEDDIPPF